MSPGPGRARGEEVEPAKKESGGKEEERARGRERPGSRGREEEFPVVSISASGASAAAGS